MNNFEGLENHGCKIMNYVLEVKTFGLGSTIRQRWVGGGGGGGGGGRKPLGIWQISLPYSKAMKLHSFALFRDYAPADLITC